MYQALASPGAHSQEGTWLGKTLGRYVVTEWRQDGGMAQIYLGSDLHGQPVVIKVPHLARVQQDPAWRERFRREVQALKRLSIHANIVRLLDAGEADGVPYLVLRYLDGGTLRDCMHSGPGGRQEPQAAEALCTWLPPVAAALDFLHAQGFVHRDVKPENVLFDRARTPYLADLGLLRDLAQGRGTPPPLTRLGGRPGTPAYMAPEQLDAQPPGPAADQFALAVVVYEWLAGRRPFLGEGADEITRAQQRPATSLHQLRPELPAELAQAVAQALAPRPLERFPTCQLFAAGLLEALDGGLAGHAPVGPPPADAAQMTFTLQVEDEERPPIVVPPAPPAPTPPLALSPISTPAAPPSLPPLPPVFPPRRRRSFLGTLFLGLFFFAAVALAAFAGSLFLAGTEVQERLAEPLAPWLEYVETPGLQRPPVVAEDGNRGRLVAAEQALPQELQQAEQKARDSVECIEALRVEKLQVGKELVKAQGLLTEVKELQKLAEQQRDEALSRAARAEGQEKTAAVARDTAKAEAGRLREQADRAAKSVRETKHWFAFSNPGAQPFRFEIRGLTWDGRWTPWKEFQLPAKQSASWWFSSAVRLQVRFVNTYSPRSQSRTQDLNTQVFVGTGRDPTLAEIDAWYDVRFGSDRRVGATPKKESPP
jgi:serine/threonine-protein kinase